MTDPGKPFSAPKPRGQNDRQVILLTGSSGLIRDGPLTCSLPPLPRRHRLRISPYRKTGFSPGTLSRWNVRRKMSQAGRDQQSFRVIGTLTSLEMKCLAVCHHRLDLVLRYFDFEPACLLHAPIKKISSGDAVR
jgi:hypothetical protein